MASAPRAIVEIVSGPLASTKALIQPGGTLRVGRTDQADLIVPQDPRLAGLHFELRWDGARCVVRDLGAAGGTRLHGQAVSEADVPGWSAIEAGETEFFVTVEGEIVRPLPPDRPEVAARKAAALAALRAEPGPLYALLDAARTDRVLELLPEAAEEYRSLYGGVEGEALAEVAPYLVALGRDGRLLEQLVREGWGQGWGVYLACARPPGEVRQHLRRLLLVEDEARGRRLYFRFYDPRALRVFLPSCSPRQRAEIFGEIGCFLLEGEQGELLRLERGAAAAAP